MTNRKLLLVGAGLTLGLVACDPDKLIRVNENPNSPTEAPPTALFTNATRNAVTAWLGSGYNLRSLSLTTQHLAEVQYPETDQYKRLGASFTTGFFDNAYVIELEDYQQIINAATENDQPGLYGPSLVMRTWSFAYLTDSWGDIPYFDALKGDLADGSLSPAYDSQEAIYDDFFIVLAQATADMAAAPAGDRLGAADPIYAGSLASWQRFSNSLRARLALRLANVDATQAQAEFLAAVAAPGGLLTSNAQNASMAWPGNGIYDNPWSVNFQTRDDHRISDRMMNIMEGANDPRIPIYAQPTEDDPSQYEGAPNALSQGTAATYITAASRPGRIFYPDANTYANIPGSGKTYPSFLMTYAEVSFMLAEAAERGWITGSAATYYNQGITASMEQWGVTDAAAIAAFIAHPTVVYTPGTEGLRRIATQQWIALFGDGGQAWAYWRRTCVPNTVKPGPDAILSTVPRRLQYSTTENSVNSASVDAAVARQGADLLTTSVYWDTNPTAAPTYTAGCGQR